MPTRSKEMENFTHFGAIIGAIVLGAAMAYALFRNKARSSHNKAIGDAATRAQYQDPAGYNPDKFRKELEPNKDGTVPKKHGEGLE